MRKIVSSQYSQQFFCPITFSLPHFLFPFFEYDFIGQFSLFVALWIFDRSHSMLYAQSFNEAFNSFVYELCLIVVDQSVQDSKPANDILPNEFSYIYCRNGGYGLNLYPFGEVIYSYQEVSHLPFCWWEQAKYVAFAHSERSQCHYVMQFLNG